MELWRLSGADFALRFDGGYGLENDGRWNSMGRPITYCSTGPALSLLEKLVHIESADMLPDDSLFVCYDAPDDLATEEVLHGNLAAGWRHDESVTRLQGDRWLDGVSSCLLRVPSVILPIADIDDRNVLINHRHADAGRIAISRIERFGYDPRLFDFGSD